MLVKVECEGGLYGWGEAGLSGRELAVSGAVDHYKQFLIGQDGMRIGALWQEMYRSQYFEGGRALTAAISAIDIALHDCLGKKLGVPVYQLLGGAHRHHVPCMVSCAANVETVKARVAEGWQNIRLSRGNGAEDETSSAGEVYSQPTTVIHKNQQGPPVRQGSDPDLFEPRIAIANSIRDFTAVRAAVGPGPTLGTDFHTRLNVAECASLLQKMPPGTLDWIEGTSTYERHCHHRPSMVQADRAICCHVPTVCAKNRSEMSLQRPTRSCASSHRYHLRSARSFRPSGSSFHSSKRV